MNFYNLYFYRYGMLFVFTVAILLGFWLYSDTLNAQKKLSSFVRLFSKIIALISIVFILILLVDLSLPAKTSHEIIEARHTRSWESGKTLDISYQTEVFTNYRRLFLYRNLFVSDVGDPIEVLISPIFEIYQNGRLFKKGEYHYFNESDFAAIRIPLHNTRIAVCIVLILIISLLILFTKPLYLKYSLPLVLVMVVGELRVALFFLDSW